MYLIATTTVAEYPAQLSFSLIPAANACFVGDVQVQVVKMQTLKTI